MKTLLGILSLVALLASVGLEIVAKSAIHEILAGVAFLVFVVAGAGSAVLEYLHSLERQAKLQTATLEQIARNTSKPGEKPTTASSVSYKIPGIN